MDDDGNTPRRSTRLKTKEIRSNERRDSIRRRVRKKQWKDDDRSSESSDNKEVSGSEEDVYTTPVKKMKATNNFTKIYNTYNMDRGNDCYEGDFIDDSELYEQKNKQIEDVKRKRKRKGVVIDSDSDENLTVQKQFDDNSSDSDNKIIRRPSISKRPHPLESESEEEEEEDEVRKGGRSKRRRVLKYGSDDDNSSTPARKSSGRAEKMRQQKDKEKEEKLRELKLKRALKKGDCGKSTGDIVFSEETSDLAACVEEAKAVFYGEVEDNSSDEDEEDCSWIITDDSIDNEDTEGCDVVMETESANHILTRMAMKHIAVSILQDIKYEPDDVIQFIEVAGRAVPVELRQLLSHVNLNDVCSTLKNEQTTLIHLIIAAPWNVSESFGNQSESFGNQSKLEDNQTSNNIDDNCHACLNTLLQYDGKTFNRMIYDSFQRHPTVLELAVWNGRLKCIKFIMDYSQQNRVNWRNITCEDQLNDVFESINLSALWPPSLLHLALYRHLLIEPDEVSLMGVDSIVSTILPYMKIEEIDLKDQKGYTPLLYAAQVDDCDTLSLLIKYKASLLIKDNERRSALHLAAASGCLICINKLITNGHEIDCRDHKGWPPLLYAHFSDHTECFLELMKSKPQQLSVLSDLLKTTDYHDNNMENKRKTAKVVRDLLVSLAHSELYYNLFNDFIHKNLEILDDEAFGFMKHCMALLSFENKQAWLENKLRYLRLSANELDEDRLHLKQLPRQQLLERVLNLLWDVSAAEIWKGPFDVSFDNEAGICTGPRREFWTCLSHELANSKEQVFQQCDDSQLCLQPCKIFYDNTQLSIPTIKQVSTHHHKLHVIGSLLAAVVFHQDTLDCNLAVPLVKQLLGHTLSPLEDLQFVDSHLHDQLNVLLKEDGTEALELTFSTTLLSTWENHTIDVPIKPQGMETPVTDQNKKEYVQCLAQFKIQECTNAETLALQKGFWKVIPKRYLKPFTPNEFSLLLSGVPHIDLEEWKTYTRYVRLSENHKLVCWFWRLVNDLTQQEKGLLLKFCTGSPRLPPGGFQNLMGLSGPTKFTLSLGDGRNKIPSAQTCFNLLLLSNYSCEQELRNKVLIAVRYGCEGFEFS